MDSGDDEDGDEGGSGGGGSGQGRGGDADSVNPPAGSPGVGSSGPADGNGEGGQGVDEGAIAGIGECSDRTLFFLLSVRSLLEAVAVTTKRKRSAAPCVINTVCALFQ